jgi:hypothetical protein
MVEIFKLFRRSLEDDGSVIESKNAIGNKIYIGYFVTDQNCRKPE